MKKILLLSVLSLTIMNTTLAQYSVKIPLDDSFKTGGVTENWITATPEYGAWTNTGAYYNCTSVAPSPSEYSVSETFTQTTSGCTVDQQRTVQPREQNTKTLAYRNVGTSFVENQTLTNQSYGTEVSGTDPNYTIVYGAGRFKTNNDYYVGIYSRVGLANIGTYTTNSNGDRVQAYYTNTAGALTTCYFRFAVTTSSGWNDSGVATPPQALSFVQKYNKVKVYDKTNKVINTYTFGSPIGTGGGYYRQANASCSELIGLYNDTSYIRKLVFLL